MRIAVLSGKGGAGKSLISTNLALSYDKACYIDLDVEEPNGYIFLKPKKINEIKVYKKLPTFDSNKCIGCRKCVDFCEFNALAFLRKLPKVFNDVCHSCGGCKIVCPVNAVNEVNHEIGHIDVGYHNNTKVVTGYLNIGEESGIGIINQCLNECIDGVNILDCPPGSACSVMESVNSADYCIIVIEPTSFGFHNFKMVYELLTILNKPFGLVINKEIEKYEPLELFIKDHDLNILMRLPYDDELALINAQGKVLVEENEKYFNLFKTLVSKIGGQLQ